MILEHPLYHSSFHILCFSHFGLSPPWTLHLRASMRLLSACYYTDDINILTLYSFLIPFMSYPTDSPLVCSSSFSWICANTTSSKKSSWSFSLKKFTSNVQSSCILSLHFMSVWIYLIYLLDYLLIIHLLLECKLHQSSVCLVYYLCPKYPEQSWYTIEISSGLTVNEFAIICLFEIICFFCFYWDIFILERGNYNHGWMGLKDFQLFWIGSKVKKNRALEYLYYMYPHPRLILVLSYSQRGNNSPTLTRNCPKMT